MRILHLTTVTHRNALAAIEQLAHLQQSSGQEVTITDLLRYRVAEAAGGAPFDIVHLHAAAPGLVPTRPHAASPAADAPTLLTIHGYAGRRSTAQQQIDATVLNGFSRVTAPNRTILDRLMRAGVAADRLRLIPTGVDPVIDPLSGLASSDGDVETVRALRRNGGRVVGCVSERQTMCLVLEALARLPEVLRPVCVLVSDGDMGGARALAEALGVTGWIRTFAYKTNPRDFSRECDWIVLPSASAGLSRAGVEAFCDRVPVVAADGVEMAELILGNRAGRLFRANDSQALAGVLAEALAMTDEDRRAICDRAHAIYRDQFRTSTMLTRYMTQYAELLSESANHKSLRPAA